MECCTVSAKFSFRVVVGALPPPPTCVVTWEPIPVESPSDPLLPPVTATGGAVSVTPRLVRSIGKETLPLSPCQLPIPITVAAWEPPPVAECGPVSTPPGFQPYLVAQLRN